MRAFLAVPADGAWVERARELVAKLRPELPAASWTRPDSWHVTLKFLGEIPAEACEQFASAIGDSMANVAAGELRTGGATLLPPRGRPRVLGVGFDPRSTALAPLAELARAAEQAGRRAGAAAEGRPFRPHVTLGRIRDPWPAAAVEEFRRQTDGWVFPEWPVHSCVLYQSRLQPSGAIHTPLREWALARMSPAVHG